MNIYGFHFSVYVFNAVTYVAQLLTPTGLMPGAQTELNGVHTAYF